MPGIKKLRKKVQRRRIETVLLAGYAIAVTCALFVSLANKNTVPESSFPMDEDGYDFSSDVMMPAFNDTAQDNPFEVLYLQVNNIKLLSDEALVATKYAISHSGRKSNVVMPIQPKPRAPEFVGSFDGIYQKERRVVVVAPGDSFIGILTSLGMESKSAANAYSTLKKVYDARTLKVGQHIELSATFDVQSKALETLDTLVIQPVRGTKYILQTNENDEFEVRVEQEKFDQEIKVGRGVIEGATEAALRSAGVPKKISGKVTGLFAHVIDFRRDVKKGDTFEVKYAATTASNGDVVSVGDILYASFTIGKDTYKMYRYKSRSGEVDYYDEKGQAKKNGLDKKPLAMRNARISSLFGTRRHPIYKTTKFHSGIDYAAPRGTAIYASGSGVIEIARYVNGYGNFIKIRHNSEYQTAYGHMDKFAAGMKPGVRVRKGQVIGYVGSTGRSTGPHLHFEILRKGQRIDPLKAKVATGTDLVGAQLADFKRQVKKMDEITEVARKSDETKQTALSEADKKTNVATAEQKQNTQPDSTVTLGSDAKEKSGSEIKTAENAVAENTAEQPATDAVKTAEPAVAEEKSEAQQEENTIMPEKLIYPPKRSSRKIKEQKLASGEADVKIVPVPAPKPSRP